MKETKTTNNAAESKEQRQQTAETPENSRKRPCNRAKHEIRAVGSSDNKAQEKGFADGKEAAAGKAFLNEYAAAKKRFLELHQRYRAVNEIYLPEMFSDEDLSEDEAVPLESERAAKAVWKDKIQCIDHYPKEVFTSGEARLIEDNGYLSGYTTAIQDVTERCMQNCVIMPQHLKAFLTILADLTPCERTCCHL